MRVTVGVGGDEASNVAGLEVRGWLTSALVFSGEGRGGPPQPQ